jgi:hypothetical protein
LVSRNSPSIGDAMPFATGVFLLSEGNLSLGISKVLVEFLGVILFLDI